MTKSTFILRALSALLYAAAAWWYAMTYHERNWAWPLALLFGAMTVVVIICLGRWAGGKPNRFQLVLRLADGNGGDKEDDRTFELLHDRFRRLFPKTGDVRFTGFDTDGCFTWFYFRGPDAALARDRVLSQLEGCRIRKGSYFLANATQSAAPAGDGPTLPLGDSDAVEGSPAVA